MRVLPVVLLLLPPLVGCSRLPPSTAAAAPSKTPTETHLAEFTSRVGVLFTKTFRGVGVLRPVSYDSISFTALRVVESGASDAVYALQISVPNPGTDGDTYQGSVDGDELAALDSALGVMIARAPQLTDTGYVEVEFLTRGGVMAGFYRNRGTEEGFIRATDNPRSIVSFPVSALPQLRGILEQGRATLRGLGAP